MLEGQVAHGAGRLREWAAVMQSEIADPYSVLNLSRTASADDLKRAYRKLSMAWHPDRHAAAGDARRQEAERRFKLINAAYVAVGEILRTKAEAQTSAAQAATAQRSDAKVEAIRSVVASAALRVVPNLPRHTYRRVVSMVEGMLLDAVALGDRAFVAGFPAFVRESLEMAGLGRDAEAEALKVLDAAADDLQWRGKGADPETWQALLRPLERARKGLGPVRTTRRAAASIGRPTGGLRLDDLLRPEPALLMAQGGLAALVLLLLLPMVPIGGTARVLLLVGDLAILGYISFGLQRA